VSGHFEHFPGVEALLDAAELFRAVFEAVVVSEYERLVVANER